MYQFIFVMLSGLTGTLIVGTLIHKWLKAKQTQPKIHLKWRFIWPVLATLSPWCESVLSWHQRSYLVRVCHQVGMPTFIKPAQLVAGVIWMVLLGALLGTCIFMYCNPAWPIWVGSLIGAVLLMMLSFSFFATRVRRYKQSISRDLPFVLELMTLSIEAGMSLQHALQQVQKFGPSGVLCQELANVLSDIRAGHSRERAFQALVDRCGSMHVKGWVSAMSQSERSGMSVGRLLREYANQSSVERIQAAEKLAMEAPVKMLLPLIGCIFPCTFIVLAFPIVMYMWQGVQ